MHRCRLHLQWLLSIMYASFCHLLNTATGRVLVTRRPVLVLCFGTPLCHVQRCVVCHNGCACTGGVLGSNNAGAGADVMHGPACSRRSSTRIALQPQLTKQAKLVSGAKLVPAKPVGSQSVQDTKLCSTVHAAKSQLLGAQSATHHTTMQWLLQTL
jgi:hypothetical protein